MTAVATGLGHETRNDPSLPRLFGRTCAAEWTRLWTARSSRWFLLGATVVVVGLGILLGFEAAADPVEIQGGAAWQTGKSLSVPAQLALFAFALTAVTSDFSTGGIVPTLQWTPRRTVLFSARTVVAVGAATGLGVLLALVASVLAFTFAGSALVLPLEDGPATVGTVAIVLGCGSAMAVGLGFLLRNTAAALVVVFLLMLVLPLLLGGLGYEWLGNRLPGTGALHLLVEETDPSGMTYTSAVVTLLAWAAAAAVLGCLRLTRSDANR